MILIVSIFVIITSFLLCMAMVLTALSDTETFKMIDRKIADKLEKRRKKNDN